MNFDTIKKQCAESQNALVTALRKSEFGSDLKSVIDQFDSHTQEYIKMLERYHVQAERACGAALVDKNTINNILKIFNNGLVDVAVIVERCTALPDNYDPTNTLQVEYMESQKDGRKAAIIGILEITEKSLDVLRTSLFQHAENAARNNPMGLKLGRYLS